jgi:hypothetical protein
MEDKCSVCKKDISGWGEAYEYRGFLFCEEHLDDGTEKVDRKREEVMEVTNHSISSQRNGEFVNNRGKYHLGNVAADGLPIIVPKEPQILKDYENRTSI